MKNKDSIFKYFKAGDTIVGDKDSYWYKTKFIINSFHGNDYLPIACAYQFGHPRTSRYLCNFDVRSIKLVDSKKRPFLKIDKVALINLMHKGVVEAKREFMIRLNTKTL